MDMTGLTADEAMQPQTSVDQHYVPKFYLRGFKGYKDKYWLLDLDSGTWENTDALRGVFSKERFHDDVRMDKENSEFQCTEKMLSQLESRFSRGFKAGVAKILEKRPPLQGEWRDILWFIAVQRNRTPSAIKREKLSEEVFARGLVSELLSRNNIQGRAPRIIVDEKATQISLLHSPDLIQKQVNEFASLSVIAHVTDVAMPFITSDTVVSAVPGEFQGRAVYFGPDAHVLVPLTPRVLLEFRGRGIVPEGPPGSLSINFSASPGFVRLCNQVVALNAEQTVLSASNEFDGILEDVRSGEYQDRGIELKGLVLPTSRGTTMHIVEAVFRGLHRKRAGR